MLVGNVGDHARELERICMMIRRSALPVRMSYKVKVRSVPIEARTEGSEALNLREVMVSEEVGKDRLEIAEDLVSSQIWTMLEAVAKSGSVRWWSIELWGDMCYVLEVKYVEFEGLT